MHSADGKENHTTSAARTLCKQCAHSMQAMRASSASSALHSPQLYHFCSSRLADLLLLCSSSLLRFFSLWWNRFSHLRAGEIPTMQQSIDCANMCCSIGVVLGLNGASIWMRLVVLLELRWGDRCGEIRESRLDAENPGAMPCLLQDFKMQSSVRSLRLFRKPIHLGDAKVPEAITQGLGCLMACCIQK